MTDGVTVFAWGTITINGLFITIHGEQVVRATSSFLFFTKSATLDTKSDVNKGKA